MNAPRQGVQERLETVLLPFPHPCRGAATRPRETGGGTPGYYPGSPPGWQKNEQYPIQDRLNELIASS